MAEDQRLRELMREYQAGPLRGVRRDLRVGRAGAAPLPAVAGTRRRQGGRPGPGDVSADASGPPHLRSVVSADAVGDGDRAPRVADGSPHAVAAAMGAGRCDDDGAAGAGPRRPSLADRADVRRALGTGRAGAARRRDSASPARIQLQGDCRTRRHRRDRGEAAIEPRHGAAARAAQGAAEGAEGAEGKKRR